MSVPNVSGLLYPSKQVKKDLLELNKGLRDQIQTAAKERKEIQSNVDTLKVELEKLKLTTATEWKKK